MMLRQPEMEAYLARIASYEHFLAIILFCAAILALIVLKFSPKGKRINIGFNLWTILGIGLIVRIPLMNQPYWYDEAFTSAMSQIQMGEFFTAIQGDVHPPGYYLIVRAFVTVFGHNGFTMRLPALLSSLGLILTMYQIGLSYGGKKTGKWAALITALLPVAAYYATEARYPMFLALMLSVAFIGIQRKRNLLVGLPLAIAGMTHVNAWFYIVIMGAVWVFSQKRVREMILPFGAMGAWFPVALNQAKDVSDGFWLEQYVPYRHLVEMTIGGRFLSANSAFLPMVIVMAIIGIAVWKWRKQVDWLWLSVAVAVPLAQWTVSILWHPIYLPRTLFLSALLLIVPVAHWLETGANRLLAFAGLISLLVGIGSLYLMDRSAASNKAIEACEGYETIYATNTHTAILATHYSDATVIVYENGNSVAQQLPHETQAVLFDQIGNIFDIRDTNICVVSQVSVFNSDDEIAHLEAIISSFNPQMQIVASQDTNLGYYLILRLNEGS